MYRDQIRHIYDTFSPSFQVLANFLLDRPYEAAFMNASQLAAHLDVDPATVVRFAQRLGYPGYPELLEEIRTEVKSDLDRFLKPQPIPLETGAAAIASVKQAMSNLQALERSLKPKDVAYVSGLIRQAERIFVVSEGISQHLGSLFAYQLRELDLNVAEVSADPASVGTMLTTVKKGDLVIAIAVTPVCQDTGHAVELARKRGATTVTVAGSNAWRASIPAEMVLATTNTNLIRLPDYATLATLLSAIFQAAWLGSQDVQQKKEKSFHLALEELTNHRNDEPAYVPVSGGELVMTSDSN